MRRARDNRRDDIVKRELYERFIAKRYDVLFVCFQVADGSF